MFAYRVKNWLVLGALLVPRTSWAVSVEPVEARQLTVVMPRGNATEAKAACQAMADLFSGSSARSFRAFEVTACGQNPTGSETAQWKLGFRRKGSTTEARLELVAIGNEKGRRVATFASVRFDAVGRRLTRLLADPDFAEVLVWTLVDQMPFIARALPGEGVVPTRRRANPYVKLPGPPESVYLYALHVEPRTGILRSQLQGKGHLTGLDDGIGWRLDEMAAASRGPLFAHATTESKLTADDYTGMVERAIRASSAPVEGPRRGRGFLGAFGPKPTPYFFQTAAAVTLVDPNTLILPRTRRLLGVAQARGGPLAGLEAEFDVMPQVEEDFEGKSYQLGWNRAAAGWSFSYSPTWSPQWLFNRIDLTPRLGFWQVDAVLPARDDEGNVTAVDYGFKSQFDAGFNLGVEAALPFGVGTRFWHARDVTTGLVFNRKSAGASSSRFGADLYVRGPELPKDFRASRLYFTLFYAAETVLFSPEQEQEVSLLNPESVQNSDALREVFYETNFVGAGVGATF